jgi:hypothetical protein
MFEWLVPLENHNSQALGWLAQELTNVSEEPERFLDSYKEVSEDENVIETDHGPLVAPVSIRLLTELLAKYESGALDLMEWVEPVHRTKSVMIRSLIALELSMIPELQPYRGRNRQISIRRGGIIVWREKLGDRAD